MAGNRSPTVTAVCTFASVLLVVAFVAATPRDAEALEADSPWHRPFSVDGVIGLFTPLGEAGIQAEAAPVPWVAISGGVGVSVFGPQEALMLHARLMQRRLSLAIGGGMSTGPYQVVPLGLGGGQQYTWNRAWWINGEISLDYREPSGWEVRAFVGLASLANSVADSCYGVEGAFDQAGGSAPPCQGLTPSPTFGETILPYFGVALGHAFGP